jgi:hypothetical protein
LLSVALLCLALFCSVLLFAGNRRSEIFMFIFLEFN